MVLKKIVKNTLDHKSFTTRWIKTSLLTGNPNNEAIVYIFWTHNVKTRVTGKKSMFEKKQRWAENEIDKR